MKLHSIGRLEERSAPIVARVTTSALAKTLERADHILVWNDSEQLPETDGYAAVATSLSAPSWKSKAPIVHSLSLAEQLSDGDVVSVAPSGFARILYRRNSPHNFILMTDQCNSFCLMCSQPPRKVDDRERIREHLRLIDLMDPDTRELGITGGEPTLFGKDFLKLIEKCKRVLPHTVLHVLSNGRLFYYRELARALAEIGHHDLMIGIPLYSDVDSEHDYVVQAKGAFEETMLGLYNLDNYKVPIEIRVVIHQQTYRRLPQLAEFIARNLPFASHVALMGMEMFGFANRNIDELWIDPCEYQPELIEATETLFLSGMNVSLYNHQLCVLDERVWPFAIRSISDWKNIYLEECQDCAMREECGGLFHSAAKKHSAHIKPFPTEPELSFSSTPSRRVGAAFPD